MLEIIILFCTAWNVLIFAAELPADIKKCRLGDYPCMIEISNQMIQRFAKGNAEMGLDPLDNIPIDDISLLNSPGPLSISYKLKHQRLKGFENSTVTKISGLIHNSELNKIEIELKVPRLLMQGNYELLGRGLLVYTNASGITHSDLQNVRLKATIKGFIEFRNNKRYLKIYDLTPQITIDRWILWADNLYKENTDLTVVLNRVVNENWLEFWNEIEPTILPVYSKSISKILGKFTQSISYDDMFLTN